MSPLSFRASCLRALPASPLSSFVICLLRDNLLSRHTVISKRFDTQSCLVCLQNKAVLDPAKSQVRGSIARRALVSNSLCGDHHKDVPAIPVLTPRALIPAQRNIGHAIWSRSASLRRRALPLNGGLPPARKGRKGLVWGISSGASTRGR